MSQAQLSIVLPVRNGADFLGEALESMLAQDCGDWVLHVSDNASDDATPEILARFAARDPRIRVSRSAEPLSQVANMNRAVALAETPWLRMLCHDDLLRADCVRQTLAAIEAVDGTGVALIGNAERHLFANGYCTEALPDAPLQRFTGREILRRRFSGDPALPPFPAVTTATLRKAAFDALGGFDERWVHFDIFAWYTLLLEHDYAAIAAQLTVNRIHGAQVAIAARASLRSAGDYRTFVGEFIGRHGAALGLGTSARLRCRLIAPGQAATAIAAMLRAGRTGAALRLLPRLPLAWLPLMPPLVLRAWHNETARLASLADKVPRAMLYPG